MPSRLSQALVHTALFCLVSVTGKIVTLALCDGLDATGISIGGDLLFGLAMGLLAAVLPGTARWLMSLTLVGYTIDAHYAMTFGGFLRFSNVEFAGDDAGLMAEGFVSSIQPWAVGVFGVALVLPHLVHKPLTRLLDRALSPPERQAWRWGSLGFPGVILVGAAVSSYLGITQKQASLAHHPVTFFAMSLVSDRDMGMDLRGPAWFSPRAAITRGWTTPPPVRPRPPGAPKLNVIVVLLESTGTLSSERKDGATMPWLDELAKHGIRYPKAYAQTPLSIKTLFTAFTGHFDGGDFGRITEIRPKIPIKTLSEFAHDEGLRTAFIHGGKFSFYHKLDFFGHRDLDLAEDAKVVPNPMKFKVGSWGIDDRAAYDRAADWMNGGEGPFCLGVVPISPHWPYELPTDQPWPWPGKRELDRYQNAVTIADYNLGSLIEAVKQAGQFENTLWVVAGDHGEAFSQHRNNKIHSGDIYEENMRVPLVISNPVLFPEALVDDQIVQHNDLLPTIIDLAGWDARGYRGDGSSLVRPREKRSAWYYTGLREPVFGSLDGDTKCIWRPESGKIEVYDLVKDPAEKDNLAAVRPEDVARCKAQTWDWQGYTVMNRHLLERFDGVDLVTLPPSDVQPQDGVSLGGSLLGPTVGLPDRGLTLAPGATVSWPVGRWPGATLSLTPALDAPAGTPGETRIEILVDGQPVKELVVSGASDQSAVSVAVSGEVLQLRASGSGPAVALLRPELQPAP